ncbi:DNA polymerase epsilon catalytic subunit, partial [Coemansia sp. RSA 1804]
QQPTFGIPPPARGGKRGRGGRGARGGYGGRRQPLPLGGGAEADGVDVAMADAYPDNNNDNNNQRDDDERAAAEDHGGGFNSIEFRNDDVLVNDQIDSKLGFERYQEGPTRLGWLVNMHATTVPDEERNSAKAAVDYYFLEQDGGSFKCTLLYKPYFYVVCAPGCETEVEEWLVRRFDRFVDGVETVEREDLQMANHLTGCKRRLVKIVFRNVQDLLAVRRELQPIIRRNEKRSDLMNA